MVIARRFCGGCDRWRLVRVLCGDELVDAIGAAASGPSLPGAWTVQVTLCPHCRSVVYAAALITGAAADWQALYPPTGGQT